MKTINGAFLAALVGVSLIAGCGGKPTEADCDKFAEKFVELMSEGTEGDAAAEMAKSLAEGMKPELKKTCMEEGTKADVQCVLDAKTMEDLEKNCK